MYFRQGKMQRQMSVPIDTKPFIAIYIVWHPQFDGGKEIAEALYDHFRRTIFVDVGGGTGVSVQFRCTASSGDTVPLTIDPDEAETSAVVVLLESHLARDSDWVTYVQNLVGVANTSGLGVRVFPVAIESGLTTLKNPLACIHQVRWDKWLGLGADAQRVKLVGALTYEFCRMLRHYLEHLKRPRRSEKALEQYLKQVRVFLSHSKHDAYGEKIATAIRDYINQDGDLATFFDAKNIPSGLNFDEVLEYYVRVSAVIAIHSDSYSSREWCRREIIEAKRSCVPLLVANCVTDVEERGFPYLGNVPVVRMDPTSPDGRIPLVINRLLDEVFKDFLWRCRVKLGISSRKKAVFLPRSPELISLVARHLLPMPRRGKRIIVYPDPPLGAEEGSLLQSVAPRLRFLSYTAWLADPH
jgi:hypothetical protein